MKLVKALIGQEVRLKWWDPCSDKVKKSDLKLGLTALAHWIERGKVLAIEKAPLWDVIHVMHSEGYSPGQSEPDEFMLTSIPDPLIEWLVTLQPVEKEEASGG